ncbi:hypothetical protein L596_000757 [Steinernema carpocapsae]|uniref:Uncharacterized protein n=1 Tax=Steinernema carpocapsae TaxID=34508 RepID=A0A4U8UJ53_STECR|nr:hypothetical protein L596_000757 [Steinernema carpocapsae]
MGTPPGSRFSCVTLDSVNVSAIRGLETYDLSIVCERFTTSKLKSHEELEYRRLDSKEKLITQYMKVSFAFRRCGNRTGFRTTGSGYQAGVICSLTRKNCYHLKSAMEGYIMKPSSQCSVYGLEDCQNRHKAVHQRPKKRLNDRRSVECPALKSIMDSRPKKKEVL